MLELTFNGLLNELADLVLDVWREIPEDRRSDLFWLRRIAWMTANGLGCSHLVFGRVASSPSSELTASPLHLRLPLLPSIARQPRASRDVSGVSDASRLLPR